MSDAKKLLVTGSSGLIGSAVATQFDAMGWSVHGIDNHHRMVLFGPAADTRRNLLRLQANSRMFVHHDLDIRDRQGVLKLVREIRPHAVVHTAAQPSHDRSHAIPFDDFDINAVGTLNLLEAVRQFSPEAPFVHMSTNKVYGDAPNRVALAEQETRWEIADPALANGFPETMPIDSSAHSLYGASKLAADVMVQEYGRAFGMLTCCLRGGCLTGPAHAGVSLHGFLSYLVRCNCLGERYVVYGYKGKQVRDNINAADVASFIVHFVASPRSAAVYNLGGGKSNSCSILEAFELVASRSGKTMNWGYDDTPRYGDHICYYSDLRRIKADYPDWHPRYGLSETLDQLVDAWSSSASPTA
jgi:CDP-paratose 2-epimerase